MTGRRAVSGWCVLVASLAIASTGVLPARPQTGSGWQDLLAGDSLEAWVDERGHPVAAGWAVKDGVLSRVSKSGSIFTSKTYENFELEFEWKIAPRGNSGLKYRMQRTKDGRWLGPEYQVLDDAILRDARNSNTSAGSLYEIIEPAADKPLKPVGEYNLARVVVHGSTIEHWLNGRKILQIDTAGDDWRQRLAKSKFSRAEGAAEWFARKAGPIMIQDHGSEVWFRGIRIRVTVAADAGP
jgi:hypothetical protein